MGHTNISRYYPENWPVNYLNKKFVINIFEENYYESFKMNDEEFITSNYFVYVIFDIYDNKYTERTHLTSI